MLVSKKIIAAINEQIGMEFAASLQYDAIGAFFATESLPQLAKHFFQQSTEEREHAHRFMKFVIDVGGQVVIPAIAAPKPSFDAAADAVRLSLERELEVTKAINELADLAQREKDHVTANFLQWFISEQLEEVSSTEQLLKMLERAGEEGLFYVEQFIAASPKKSGGKG
jgi:ferritin